MRRLFIGPNGIRVGWRLLLFFIFFAVLVTALQYLVMKLPVLSTAMRKTHTGTVTPLGLFGYELANIVSVFVAMAAMAEIEKRRFGDYGLKPFPGAAKRLVLGFAFGLLMVTAICALQRAEHVYAFGSLGMTPASAFAAGLGWAVVFLLVGIVEESVFRGYAQFTLTQATGFWPAAIVISLLFGVTHLSNTNYKAAGCPSPKLWPVAESVTYNYPEELIEETEDRPRTAPHRAAIGWQFMHAFCSLAASTKADMSCANYAGHIVC